MLNNEFHALNFGSKFLSFKLVVVAAAVVVNLVLERKVICRQCFRGEVTTVFAILFVALEGAVVSGAE